MLKGYRLELRRYEGADRAHSHDHHQIVLPLQGWMEMDVDGRQEAVTGRHAAVIPAGRQHHFDVSAENHFLILDVTARDLSFAAWPPVPGRDLWAVAEAEPFVPLDPAFSRFCGFVANELTAYDQQGWAQDGLSRSLLEALARRMDLPQESEPVALGRAKAFMAARFEQTLDVGDIARAAHVSPSRLFALFRDHLGTSPQGFLADLRMERAAGLLMKTELSVAQVALAVGYGDQSAFSRAFRRHLGQSPGAYRRARRAESSFGTKTESPGQDRGGPAS